MVIPRLHRLLGLAAIYGRLALQEKRMADTTAHQQTADEKVEELAANQDKIVEYVTGVKADLDALKAAQSSPDDETTLSAAGAAALDSALAKSEAFLAGIAPAPTPDPGSAPTPVPETPSA